MSGAINQGGPAQPAAPAEVVADDWRIDNSTPSPILVYKNCSVIQDEQAHWALSVIHAALRTPAQATSTEPVAKVLSWTSGSYWRNYKLEWIKDVPEGTLLYDAPPVVQPASPAVEVASDSAAYLIYYDDRDRTPEIIIGTEVARARFKAISVNWNAHLFGKLESNSRDERWANCTLATPPAPAAVTEGASGSTWRPIKTAPRDGSNILLRFGLDGVSQGKYVPGVPHPWTFIDTNDGITWMVNSAIDGLGGPSHWQPMPSATPHPAVAVPGSLTPAAHAARLWMNPSKGDAVFRCGYNAGLDAMVAALATTSAAAQPESGVKP